MKKIVEETESEGLEKLLGERVQIWCLNYIYTGKLKGVNEHDVLLADAGVVYETGELQNRAFKNVQKLPSEWYVRISAIESYGLACKDD